MQITSSTSAPVVPPEPVVQEESKMEVPPDPEVQEQKQPYLIKVDSYSLATASESQQPVTHLNDINSITPGRVIVNNSTVTLFPDSPQTPRNNRCTTPSEKPGTLASNNNKFLLLGNGEEDSHQTAAGLDNQPSDLNNQPTTTEKHTENITENHTTFSNKTTNLPSKSLQDQESFDF